MSKRAVGTALLMLESILSLVFDSRYG